MKRCSWEEGETPTSRVVGSTVAERTRLGHKEPGSQVSPSSKQLACSCVHIKLRFAGSDLLRQRKQLNLNTHVSSKTPNLGRG